MKGQNIKKYWQKEFNLMCKTDKKTRNYIILLPRNKMSHGSRENWICKNELIIRHLKIPGRDELGQLPEVNWLNRACARELSPNLSAVLISSRTPFCPCSRRIEDVSILHLFCPDNCSNRLFFSYIDRNVYSVHSFRGCNVEYYAEIRKCEWKYSSSVRLCFCSHHADAITSVQAQYKLYALRIQQCKYSW